MTPLSAALIAGLALVLYAISGFIYAGSNPESVYGWWAAVPGALIFVAIGVVVAVITRRATVTEVLNEFSPTRAGDEQ